MEWPLVPIYKGLSTDDYTVGWICALPKELNAALNMLDEQHRRPSLISDGDKNSYTFGCISGHNVVVACQSGMGSNPASTLIARMDSTFQKLRFVLLVGIAGGVGVMLPGRKDINLGDVVISKGYGEDGGVIVHDRGRQTHNGFQSRPFLNGVPEILRNSFSTLEALHMNRDTKITTFVSNAAARNPRFKEFCRPNPNRVTDRLFSEEYIHKGYEGTGCAQCDKSQIIRKRVGTNQQSAVHFGLVASGNQVIVDSKKRGEILKAYPNVLAVEMEAAGTMDIVGCATIRGICDYADSHKNDEWQNYAAAAAAAVAKEVLELIPMATSGKPRPFDTMIYPRNKLVVSRESIFEQIDKLLPSDDEAHRAAIWGIGGSGKTQIALQYAYRRQENTSCSLFWVHTSTRTRFTGDYKEIAKKAQLPPELKDDEMLGAVCDWLKKQVNWLMILDNADDLKIFDEPDFPLERDNQSQVINLYQYIPQTSGCLLWTSRDRSILGNLVDEKQGIEVPKMESGQSLELLRRLDWADNSNSASPDEEALLGPDGLDNLPLAIVGARAFIHTTKMPIAEYLQNFKKSEVELLSEEFRDSYRRDVPNSVMKTWQISFDRVVRELPAAERLIKIISFFDNQGIPIDLIRESAISKDGDNKEDVSDLKVRKIIGRLTDFSFLQAQQKIQEDDVPTYEQHRLLQLAMRNSLEPTQSREFFKKAREIMQTIFPGPDLDFKDWDLCKRYLPHALKVAELNTQETSAHFALLWQKIGSYHYTQGLFKQAEMYQFQAMKRLQSSSGDLHENTILAMHQLAMTYQFQGAYDKAEPLKKQVLESSIAILGERHPDTIAAMHNLAFTWHSQGAYDKAELLQKQVSENSIAVLGERHPATIVAMHNLAYTWYSQGAYDKAELLQKQVLENSIAVLGERHPDIIAAMNNLASTWHSQGAYDKAEPLQKQVLKLRTAVLGERHPDTIAAMNNLASTWHSQGAYDKAEPLKKQVLESSIAVLGERHPDTIKAMSNLAYTWYSQGAYDKAEPLLKQVLKLQRAILGERHPDIIAAMNNLAFTWHSQGAYDKAELLQKQVLVNSIAVLGERHPATIAAMYNLAYTWYSQGAYDKAELLQKQVLENSIAVLGERHPDTIAAMHNLAYTWYSQGAYDKAEPLQKQVLENSIAVLGERHPDTIAAMNNLAFTWHSQGAYDKAEPLLKQVLELQTAVLGERHPDTTIAMNNLAFDREKQEHYLEAEKTEIDAQKQSTSDHPDTIRATINLLRTYDELGRNDEAGNNQAEDTSHDDKRRRII